MCVPRRSYFSTKLCAIKLIAFRCSRALTFRDVSTDGKRLPQGRWNMLQSCHSEFNIWWHGLGRYQTVSTPDSVSVHKTSLRTWMVKCVWNFHKLFRSDPQATVILEGLIFAMPSTFPSEERTSPVVRILLTREKFPSHSHFHCLEIKNKKGTGCWSAKL